MLTNSDLKQIQQVVQGELRPIKKDIEVLKDDVGQIKTKELPAINKDIKSVKKDVVQIRRDVKTMISFFDREYLELRERVERIEEHLQLSLAS